MASLSHSFSQSDQVMPLKAATVSLGRAQLCISPKTRIRRRSLDCTMARRMRSALLCIFLLTVHLIEGTVAAAVPCADDSPGVLVVCAVDPPASTAASAQCDGTLAHVDQCPFCSAGGCQLTHVPTLVQVFADVRFARQPCCDTPALKTDALRFQNDRILRPPK